MTLEADPVPPVEKLSLKDALVFYKVRVREQPEYRSGEVSEALTSLFSERGGKFVREVAKNAVNYLANYVTTDECKDHDERHVLRDYFANTYGPDGEVMIRNRLRMNRMLPLYTNGDMLLSALRREASDDARVATLLTLTQKLWKPFDRERFRDTYEAMDIDARLAVVEELSQAARAFLDFTENPPSPTTVH